MRVSNKPPLMKVSISKKHQSGFTMLEVLFAGLVLAMSTFTILGLLKLSDEMSYRAKADAKVSQIFKSRASILSKGSFENLRQIAMTSTPTPVGSTTYRFRSGGFSTNYVSNVNYYLPGTSFPFLDLADPLGGSIVPQDTKYLLSGKPLPGDTLYRNIFPFIEEVELVFNSNPSSASKVDVRYSLVWVYEFIRSTQRPVGDNSAADDYEKLRIMDFYFVKYDPSAY